MIRLTLATAILLVVQNSSAEQPTLGPVIEGFGPVYTVADRDISLIKDFKYRVVFDAAEYPGDPAALNQELETVARFLNMHALNGVPAENMEVAVVLHGAALKSTLRQDAYSKRYQVDNPNLALLMALDKAGVKLYACGQSLGFRNFSKNELTDPVKVGLSAMTLLTTFQADGFALLP